MSEESASQDMIPKARLDEVIAQRDRALAKATAAEKRESDWKTKWQAAETARVEAVEAGEKAVAELREAHETDKVFGAVGIDDPRIIELLRDDYNKLEVPPKEDGSPGERPTMGEWFTGHVATKPPKWLTPYLKAPEPAKPTTPPAKTLPAKSAGQPPAPAQTQRQQPASISTPADHDPDAFGRMDAASRRAILAEQGLYVPKTP